MIVDLAAVLAIVIQMGPVASIGQLRLLFGGVNANDVYLRNELTGRQRIYFRRPYATSMQRILCSQ